MSRPAPFVPATMAQAAMEARLTARRGENLLAMIAIPVGALVFLGTIGAPGGRGLEALLPGVLALAIVASGLVNLGIATAYERGYGVLKRLGGTPLGRDGLITAKTAVAVVIGLVQVVALVAIALVLGWSPGPGASPVAVLVTTLLGSATFAALGLLLAGTLRPEAALVVANVAFLAALVLGGVLVPIDNLPAPLATVANVLPFGALAQAYGAGLGGGDDGPASLAIVAGWGLAALVAAVRAFRWD